MSHRHSNCIAASATTSASAGCRAPAVLAVTVLPISVSLTPVSSSASPRGPSATSPSVGDPSLAESSTHRPASHLTEMSEQLHDRQALLSGPPQHSLSCHAFTICQWSVQLHVDWTAYLHWPSIPTTQTPGIDLHSA